MKRIWTIHLAALVALVTWIATDPSFKTMVRSRSFVDANVIVGSFRVTALATVVTIAAISLVALFFSLFRTSKSTAQSRSVGQWLTITVVIALWCSLAFQHDAIAWQGKTVRFAFRVNELEAIAEPLRDRWPERDRTLATIGPFMVYPFGRPTTLILLQAPRVANRFAYVSTVERRDDGAIKLQLTGTDGGDWAEWHPPDSRPTSFIGGLADPHQLHTATAIGSG